MGTGSLTQIWPYQLPVYPGVELGDVKVILDVGSHGTLSLQAKPALQ